MAQAEIINTAGIVPMALRPWGIPSAVVTTGRSMPQNQTASKKYFHQPLRFWGERKYLRPNRLVTISPAPKNRLIKGERKGKPEILWRQFKSPEVKYPKILCLK